MKGFSIKTEIEEYDTFEQYVSQAQLGSDDLILCGEHTYDKYIVPHGLSVQTLFREKFGKGEPTDGMVHSVESFLSPNGCSISRIFSTEALTTIIKCWKKSVEAGCTEAWKEYAADFLKASNWAGLGFGYAGCAAVHATAYPLGSVYHIPHGQSNQLMFRAVMEKYKEIKPVGRINDLENVIADALEIPAGSNTDALKKLYELMDRVLKAEPLHKFGVKESDLSVFANSVINTQQRLMRNNYVEITEEQVLDIYKEAF